MSTSRRRNGLNAACEPCRRSKRNKTGRKIRCDNGRPVCGRCRRRSLSAGCYYHPAPLTSSIKASVDRLDLVDIDREHLPTPTSGNSTETQRELSALPSSANKLAGANLHYIDNIRSGVNRDLNTPAIPSVIQNDDNVQLIAGFLDALRWFDHIQHAVNVYYQSPRSSFVPAPLILPILDSLQTLTGHAHLFEDVPSNDTGHTTVAHAIWKSTTRAIDTSADTTPAAFVSMYSGPNLRLEYLGLVCSIAALSHILWAPKDGRKNDDFVRDMFHCSTACLALARRLTPVNLPMAWLSLDHMHLCGNIHGDTHEIVWHRLGDVSNDVLALGLHKEANNTGDIPEWLAECRRKMFIKAYTTDMAMSELFNRPPRLLRRHSDCAMPLDLSDEELLAEPVEFELARSRLSSHGWNLRGELFSTTYSRLRCTLMEIREEVFGYEFRRHAQRDQIHLNALSERNRQSWENLPPYLKYTIDNSAAAAPSAVRLMVSLVYLAVLETDMQILKLQERESPQPVCPVMRVASEILALVVELAAFPRHLVSACNYSRIIFKYGLPSAFSLALTLPSCVRQTTQASPLPHGVTVSSLIRNLSVFVSQLKNAAVPGEANYDVCRQASKAISATLDEILDGSLGSTNLTTAPIQAAEQQSSNLGLLDPASFNAPMDVHAGRLDLWSDFDVEGWLSSIERSAPGEEWAAF